MINLLRIAGSFAIVLVVYWTYALTAVPLIEPSVEKRSATAEENPIPEGPTPTEKELEQLAPLFPPGSLRMENPKILQRDRVKLLLGEYDTEPGGNVRIRPCIIILMPEADEATPSERLRQAVVLEAPQGAVLRFDREFDLTRARIGRLLSGRLDGPITIRSAGKTDSPDDDLLVVTQDVQLTEKRVWTQQAVRFRYGPHFGSGRAMNIQLLPGDGMAGTGRHGPNISGLESFELARLDRLHLLLPGKDLPANVAGAAPATMPRAQATPPGGGRPREDLHVEITCDGPFRFDAVRLAASFERQVVVTGMRGTADQHDRLENCDLLSVYFKRQEKPDSAIGGDDAKRPGLDNLTPCRLVAVGNPVRFRSPSEFMEGRAERVEYDMIREDLTLEGNQPVFVQHKSNQIEARGIRYWSPESPWLTGRVTAAGPGWIRAEINDRPGQFFEARWNSQLQFRPHEQNQVISLTGGAQLAYEGIGQLTAGEIHFRLFEHPPAAGSKQPRFEPDRMQAYGDVRLASPKISGELAELEVWFEQAAAGTDDAATANQTATGSDAGGQGGRPPANAAEASGGPTEPENHFHVTARRLRARILLNGQGKKPDVEELTVSDHVNLVQTQMAAPDDKPVVVRGESIHVLDATKPYAALTIKGIEGDPGRGIEGKPAYFEGRGLTMVGWNINLNQGTNRLWIDGPGRMDLPALSRDLQGRSTKTKEPLRVEWRDRMEFDGRTVTFEGKVRAASKLQQLLTETLKASIDRMIQFSQPETLRDRTPTDLQELFCQGRVWMESRTLCKTDQNVQESYEQVETQNLRINNASGALAAQGPGYLRSVSRSSGQFSQWASSLPGNGPPGTTQAAGTADAEDNKPLQYLHVRFQGGIAGNVHKEEITFHDQVNTVFGKVDAWEDAINENDPNSWGKQDGVLSTDQLTVRQMPAPLGGEKSMELEAIGNTRVEGKEYAAFCTRMAFDQVKGMMLFEGDGQTNARLLYQTRAGALRDGVSAQRFRYWPKTNTMDSDGFSGGEIHQLGMPQPGRR